MQHTKEAKYTKTWITCDVCNECTEYSGTIKQCYGCCEKDICSRCGVMLYEDLFDGDEYGDTIVIVCKECNEALQPYADKAAEIRKEVEEKLDNLRERWFRKDRTLDTP